jgi:predicted TPR repeat methyltransferase
MPTNKESSAFVSQAYSLADDNQSHVDFYKKGAADYDHEMLDKLGYTSPSTIASLLIESLPEKSSRIIDIGCGTGLTCTLLHDQGYTHLEGIDLSPDMLQVASHRDIYLSLFTGDLNLPLKIESNIYDAAISSGTFTHGHVGAEPLDEVVRILKPGGILAITVHCDLWQTHGFEAKLESLVSLREIELITLKEGAYYKHGVLEGWFCVYRKKGL